MFMQLHIFLNAIQEIELRQQIYGTYVKCSRLYHGKRLFRCDPL